MPPRLRTFPGLGLAGDRRDVGGRGTADGACRLLRDSLTVTVGSDKFAFVEIIQALRRNELVAMLVDRPYLNSGIAVQFFERPTLFSAAAARVWQHTQASVIPAFVLQLEPGQYGCYAYPPIEMTANQTLEQNSQRVADVFQAIIREFPEQWFNFVPIWNP